MAGGNGGGGLSNWTHERLRRDLARSRIGVGEVVVEELSLGFWGTAGSMDVWTQKLSRTTPRPTCFEVKASRSDFLSDVRSGKHRRYEPFAERFLFAVPSGLVDRRELPDGWGLIVRGEKGWHVFKAGPRRQMKDEAWRPLMLAVLIAMHPGPWNEAPRDKRLYQLAQTAQEQQLQRAVAGQFGKRVAAVLRSPHLASQYQ